MSDSERVYKQDGQGNWGWVTEVETGGGGSQPTARATMGTDNATTIADDSSAYLPWGVKFAGDDLFDLSDPLAPMVLVAGIYAFTASVFSTTPLTVGGTFGGSLTVNGDVEGNGVTNQRVGAIGLNPPGTAISNMQLSLVCYCAIDAPIAIQVNNGDGAESRDFGASVFVQRVS
jgi:hypothetical protein